MIPKRLIKACATKDFWLYRDKKSTEMYISQSFHFKYQKKVGSWIVCTSIDYHEREIVFNCYPPSFSTKKEEERFRKEVEIHLKPIKKVMKTYLEEQPEYRLRILTGELRLIGFE